MKPMKFKIDEKIFERFPSLNLGLIVAKEINNAGENSEIAGRLAEQTDAIRKKYHLETLFDLPEISAWQEAYRAFGAKPKDNKSSVENLYRAILQGKNLRPINKLVDLYNLVSLKHLVPVGGEDTDQMQGDVTLTFAGPDEPPVLLLGDKEARPPHDGEVIYKDEVSAICRRWNWREADRTKLTETTKNCLLAVEGLPPVTRNQVEDAAKELQELTREFCGGKISVFILDAARREIEI